MDDESSFRQQFEEEIHKIYNGRSTKPAWTHKRISEVITWIEEFLDAPKSGRVRNTSHYHYAHHYDVSEMSGEKCLLLKRQSATDPIIKVVPAEEYFDTLSVMHLSTGHGGRDKMVHVIKSQCFIPTAVVIAFVKLCKVCQRKKSNPKKDAAVLPKASDNFNSCGLMDLIDLQSTPDENYKWILHYQDQTTKFSFLRPLTSNGVEEVAVELLKIFLEIGCPAILSNDDREFAAALIKELAEMWPGCEIICKRSEKSASQDSAESAIQQIENMLQAWMRHNNSTNWGIGLYFVQFQINCSLHQNLQKTPYKALFGVDPRTKADSQVPVDLLIPIDIKEI